MKLFLVVTMMLIGCTSVSLQGLGTVDDAGSCNVLVLPGTCKDALQKEKELEVNLYCNAAIVFACDCENRLFMKLCDDLPPNNYAWECTLQRPWKCESWRCGEANIGADEEKACVLWGCLGSKAWCFEVVR